MTTAKTTHIESYNTSYVYNFLSENINSKTAQTSFGQLLLSWTFGRIIITYRLVIIIRETLIKNKTTKKKKPQIDRIIISYVI